MALLQPDKVVFYHPLDDSTETTKAEPWGETTTDFATGKVGNALQAPLSASFGAETQFNPAVNGVSIIAVTSIDPTHVVVAYEDDADSGHGTARVGTVSGSTITYGAETEFLSTGVAGSIGIDKLDSTHVVVVYRDTPDSSHGTARVGTISGTGITFGSDTEFKAATAFSVSVAALSSTKFVVAYADGGDSNHGTANVGTVSGTSITFGPETEFNPAGSNEITVMKLDATHVAVVFRNTSSGDRGTARVGTVSGTSITFGAETVFLATSTFQLSATAIDSTHIVPVYRDFDDGGHGTARVGTISGTSIAFGPETEFLSTGNASSNSAAALDSTHVVVVYADGSDSDHGTARIGTISGSSITFGPDIEFFSTDGTTGGNLTGVLDSSNIVVIFLDDTDFKGRSKVGSIGRSSSLTESVVAYPSTIGATQLAFVSWVKNPSV